MPNFKVFTTLGVSGLALGVFYYLFVTMKWSLGGLSSSQTFAGAVIFMVLVATVMVIVFILHRPIRPTILPPGQFTESVNIPANKSFEALARTLAKDRVVQFEGFQDTDLRVRLSKGQFQSPGTVKTIENLYALANGKLPRYEVIDDQSGKLIIRTVGRQ